LFLKKNYQNDFLKKNTIFTTNFFPGFSILYFPDEFVELAVLIFPQFNFARIATIPVQFHKFRNVPDSGLPTTLPVSQKTSTTWFQGMPRYTSFRVYQKIKIFQNQDTIKIVISLSFCQGVYVPG